MNVFYLNDDLCREAVDINDQDVLNEMYRLLRCDCVDCKSFNVGKYTYDIWYDDEYHMKVDRPVATFLLKVNGHRVPICGQWLIAKSDEDGHTKGLNKMDIKRLWKYTDINGIELCFWLRRNK